jgi:hypothetical protein
VHGLQQSKSVCWIQLKQFNILAAIDGAVLREEPVGGVVRGTPLYIYQVVSLHPNRQGLVIHTDIYSCLSRPLWTRVPRPGVAVESGSIVPTSLHDR